MPVPGSIAPLSLPPAVGGREDTGGVGCLSRRRSLALLGGGLLLLPRLGRAEETDLQQAEHLVFEARDLLAGKSLYQLKPQEVLRGILVGVRPLLPQALADESKKAIPAALTSADPVDALNRLLLAVLERAAQGQAEGARRKLAEKALRAYMSTLDRYSDYLDPATWAVVRQITSEKKKVGLGLLIIEDAEGRFALYPYASEAADLAGISAKDRLLAIEGRAVAGRSKYELAKDLLGEEGSATELTVQQEGAAPRKVKITRTLMRIPPVETKEGADGLTLKIRNFSKNCPLLVRAAVQNVNAGVPMTIDLRDCPGGEFDAALLTAMVFLPNGTEIARLATVSGEKTYVSTNQSPYRPKSLRLMMNGGTASAAELLIDALTQKLPEITTKEGSTTFGKGLTQQEFELEAGGGLTFSDSRLLGPGGTTWEGIGIKAG